MELPTNRFKARLKSGKAQIGIWSTLPDPSLVEAIAGAGFDWMVLDTEHSAVEVSQILPLLQAAAPYATDCLVRPHVNDTALIKRHLDQGAMTLLIPYIESRDQAEAAAAAVHYPPRGVRGVAGTMRAARYGRVKNYAARADAEIGLILQVETALGLTHLEEIASVDGVDGIFIGPSDLAASMGYPGHSGHPEVRKAVLSAIARLAAIGVPSGLLTQDQDFADETIAAGAAFVAVAVDMSVFVRGIDAVADRFKG